MGFPRCSLLLVIAGLAAASVALAEPSASTSARATDHEFAAGSKLALTTLTPGQVQNLATLGRVWGFLKYYHPRVSAGALQWDYELFRVAPAVLGASDRATAARALLDWTDRLGPLPAGVRAPLPTEGLALAPDLAWLDDPVVLGAPLSSRLRAIAATAAGHPFYVSVVPAVGNPQFKNEPIYDRSHVPDSGYQLLALFRFWNAIRYWFPYRDQIPENWDAVLEEFIPRIALASTANEYDLQILALIARVGDTHANLWPWGQTRPPTGDARLPGALRFIENQLIVSETPPSSVLHRGDILLAIDGTPIADLVRRWAPYYSASNEPTRRRDLAMAFSRGRAGSVSLKIRRDHQDFDVTTERLPDKDQPPQSYTHDLPGPAFRLLSPQIAYLKLSSIDLRAIPDYVERARRTRGWIIDIRGYPAAFVVSTLGDLFVNRPTPFAYVTHAVLDHPGAFLFREIKSIGPRSTLLPPPRSAPAPALFNGAAFEVPAAAEAVEWAAPNTPAYTGKVVVLVDEFSQSQAEYTAMALRAAGATIVGSTTAGADGDISVIPLPGGLRAAFSGSGIFYPDKRPTQRVGIVPDVFVTPTIAGIRDGRDEVLEAALRQILGSSVSDAELLVLSQPRN